MKSLKFAFLLLLAGLSVPDAAAGQTPAPWTVQQIEELLKGGFTGADVLRRMGSACINFRVAGAEAQLRQAGADDALIRALRNVCYRGPGAGQAPAPRGIVLLEGWLPPGFYREVNDAFRDVNRLIDLTPGQQRVVAVYAPGWCPDRREVTMAAGDTLRWTPKLRPRPLIGGC